MDISKVFGDVCWILGMPGIQVGDRLCDHFQVIVRSLPEKLTFDTCIVSKFHMMSVDIRVV